MKKEEDVKELNRQLNKGVWHAATNPFELAFRKNKDIASFLDERERAQRSSENISLPKDSEEIEDKVEDIITRSDSLIVDDSTTSGELLEETPSAESSSTELASGNEEPLRNLQQGVNAIPETFSEDSDSSNKSSPESDLAEVLKEEYTETKLAMGSEEDSQLETPTVEEVIVTDEIKITDVENAIVLDEAAVSNENGGSADPATCDDSTGEIGDQILSSQIQVPEAGNSTRALVKGKLETETPMVTENKAIISPALVKQLHEETGAGMMDCKKALSETGGDIIKAQEFLRKKGLASAGKKASRATAEGRVGSYIHDSRIGVLIEVNCETDFVSQSEIFKQLVDDLAMQVVACPQVRYLVTEDVPEEIVNKEREIEMQKEDLLSKPENLRSKIVDGRIRKRLEEFALLEQPYIKNDKTVVKDYVKQTIATIGENIKVREERRKYKKRV